MQTNDAEVIRSFGKFVVIAKGREPVAEVDGEEGKYIWPASHETTTHVRKGALCVGTLLTGCGLDAGEHGDQPLSSSPKCLLKLPEQSLSPAA